MLWVWTCSFATPWTGQQGDFSRPESQYDPVTLNTPGTALQATGQFPYTQEPLYGGIVKEIV